MGIGSERKRHRTVKSTGIVKSIELFLISGGNGGNGAACRIIDSALASNAGTPDGLMRLDMIWPLRPIVKLTRTSPR